MMMNNVYLLKFLLGIFGVYVLYTYIDTLRDFIHTSMEMKIKKNVVSIININNDAKIADGSMTSINIQF